MNPATITGLFACFTLLLPVVIILYCKLYRHKSMLSLWGYFLLTCLYNLADQGVFPLNNEIRRGFGIVNNYLDVPLILIALLLFCTSSRKRTAIYISLVGFVIFEIFVGILFQFNRESLTYILGPGLLLIFCWSVILFTQHVKLSIEKNKGFGKTFMITSILFAYGCYMIVYYFYYIQKTNDVSDVLLIYYIISIISALLMTIGLVLIYQKSRKIEEVQVTRKELAVFFQR